MQNRRLAAAFAVVASAALAGSLALVRPADAASSLKQSAEAKSKYFGTALVQSNLNNSTLVGVATAPVRHDDARQRDEVGHHRALERELQLRSRRRPGGFRAGALDAGARAQPGVAQPAAVVGVSLPTNQVQGAMETHITTEATHYKGEVYSWDVVNEPFNEDGTLRADAFYNAMGTGYIADAIRTAHAADPNAKLYLNDYNIEGENAKSNAMYSLVQSLIAQGVPIDGVGLESHFILGQVPSTMLANMQRFAALGVDVAVTELDDRIQLPASSANLQQQATDYSTVVSDCLAVTRCVGVSQWGVGDADSWIPGTFSGFGAATMYDQNYQAKPAYTAALNALGGTVSSSSSSTPTSPTSSSSSPGGGGGAACKVTDAVNAWNTGLTENITVSNTGSSAVNGWSLVFTLASGQTTTSTWNATISPTSGQVTAKNMSYNAAIAPGGSVSFGFQANHTGNTAAPSAFSLNGQPCSNG